MVEQTGYAGIAVLMLLENVFPPIPSELIMPASGFTGVSSHLNIEMVLVAGTTGSVGGAVFWYSIGQWLSCEYPAQSWVESNSRRA